MSIPTTIQFDLLTGLRDSNGNSERIGIVPVTMDLTALDTAPLTTQAATTSYEAYDTWASPLLFEGVPAVLCAKNTPPGSGNSCIFILPYPSLTQQGSYVPAWPAPLKKVDVPGMGLLGWHGLEALGDNLFLVADPGTGDAPPAPPPPVKGWIHFVDGGRLTKDGVDEVADLEGAHAVIWDPTSRRIFALGATLLRVYSLDRSYPDMTPRARLVKEGEADFSALYKGRMKDGKNGGPGWGNWADGGHDLYFMAGERHFFLTTGERCFTVDIEGLLRDLDQAKEPDGFGEVRRVIWQLPNDGALQSYVSLFEINSTFSDNHLKNDPDYPRNKVGAKAINRIPGTSVTFVHGVPYYNPENTGYLSKILLVSRGKCDRPNLYDPDPSITSTNLRMILRSDTYRCRVMPRMPLPKVDQELPVLESVKLQFCGWTGSLGKIGSPYLRVTGIGQQISNLFQTLEVPPTMDGDNNLYGFCVIEKGDYRREAIIRIHQCTETCSDDHDGTLVCDNPKRLMAVYAWAAPFVLNWTAKVTSDGLTVTGDMAQSVDQKLESVSAWLKMKQGPSGYMVQLSITDKHKRSFLETIPSKAQPFYSLLLFAKSVEGFLYCSGEHLIAAEDKCDKVEP